MHATPKYDVIAQWKEDMMSSIRDTEYPKFNMNYEIIANKKRGLEGDAALFLAHRYADVDDLITWYKDKKSHEIITMYVGIPESAAYQLLNPHHKIFDYAKITPQHFIKTLDAYLLLNAVVWTPEKANVPT